MTSREMFRRSAFHRNNFHEAEFAVVQSIAGYDLALDLPDVRVAPLTEVKFLGAETWSW